MVDHVKNWVLQLSGEYLQICYSYRIKLKKPVIEVRAMETKWGQWDPETRTLSLASRLIENYSWDTVLEILKHEMAHQYVTDIYGSDESHGSLFKEACEKLGVVDWARKAESAEDSSLQPGTQPKTEEESRLLRRVEKLLALATSSNEHEALLAMQKVQEIYAKYNLERVEGKTTTHYASHIISTRKKRLDRFQYVICSILNEHFFVEVIHAALYDAKDLCEYKIIELLGTRENVQMAEYVYHFLMNQTHILWNSYRLEKVKHRRARNSYLLGVVSGFREKLDTHQRKTFTREVSVALVPKNDKALEVFVRTRYPRLVKIQHGSSMHETAHYNIGKTHGSNLVLHRGIHRSDGNSGKLIK